MSVDSLASSAWAGDAVAGASSTGGDCSRRRRAEGGNADLVVAYANEKNGQRFATVPVAVVFTRDFVELHRYVEYPAIYHKERVIDHLRAARAGETDDQAKARGGRDIGTLLESPFFDVWAQAGLAEILSALHERLVIAPAR